jgi:VanZ family protein
MIFAKGSKWIAVAGVVLLAVVVADSLVPVTLQVRLGLHWLIEHFLAYFALTLLFCLAWPRPFVVAVALMAIASAIELLQGLTADRIPDLATAFCGAAGVLVAALLASVITDVRRKGRARAASG